MAKLVYLLCVFLFFESCYKNKKEENCHTTISPETKTTLTPTLSLEQPKKITAGKPLVVKAGIPKVSRTNTNVQIVGNMKSVLAPLPRLVIPNKDSFLISHKVTAIDSSFLAGIPVAVIAKEMANKDENSQNFSTFGKQEGLKHGTIRCMLQDKGGNIWFGTYGGITKYDGKTFANFTENEGLPSNIVRSILEDIKGNIWIGTENGICKYNGKSFTIFTNKELFFKNTVRSILEDKKGNLWFGTDKGIICYDGVFFTVYVNKKSKISNTVWSILEDKNGNIWFGTDGSGVIKYDGTQFKSFTVNEGLANNIVLSILEDKQGNIWFGTDGNAVVKYDGEFFVSFEKNYFINNTVRTILQDKQGNIWFGTDQGIALYDGNTFTTFTEKEGLPNDFILSLLEDRNRNIWIGTNGGVSKYDGQTFTFFTENEGLSNNFILSSLEDRNGNLWLGSYVGVSKYNGQTFATFTKKEGLPSNTVWSMTEDKNGNFWLGTDGGVVKYDGKSFATFTKKEGLPNNTVWSMTEDKNGNLWFGTDGGGVSKYDGKSFTNFNRKTGLSGNIIWSIIEDKRGNVWLGTDGGVSKYDGENFTTYKEKDGLSSDFVLSVLEDKSGNIWFGSNYGVSRYDGKKFITFTEKDGLTNNAVLSLLEDKSGNIWFGTRFGLSKLSQNRIIKLSEETDANTLRDKGIFFKNYTYTDGFLGIGVNGGKSMCQTKDGSIWIGANDRLTMLHPNGIRYNDTIGPNIQLTSVELFNETIQWNYLEEKKDTALTLDNGVRISNVEFDGLTNWYGLPKNLSLAYNNNYLTFNFIGITMNQPKNVKYQYILEGMDENWSTLTNKTYVTYGNLPNGLYTFKIKAMNSEGFWSNSYEYKFTIRPPFWKTWWFRTFVIIVIIGVTIFYIKWRERKLKLEKQVLEKTVIERTSEVIEEKKIVEHQKHIIEEAQKEISDSINYAKRIQSSFMASKEELDAHLNNYFIVFKPKDVVSGDFYWANSHNNYFYLCTADSTGHGIPGAFMSLLNISLLNEALFSRNLNNTSDILNFVRKILILGVKADESGQGGKDGMDCSLMRFDFTNKLLTYSAANNPIWVVRKCNPDKSISESVSDENPKPTFELIELKPDKMPVGKHDKQDVSFTQHQINLQEGDVVYTLTDGFPDQFGGPKGKKFMSKNLRELLLANAHLPMQQQKELLETTFKNWVGNTEQIDDVTLIGIKV